MYVFPIILLPVSKTFVEDPVANIAVAVVAVTTAAVDDDSMMMMTIMMMVMMMMMMVVVVVVMVIVSVVMALIIIMVISSCDPRLQGIMNSQSTVETQCKSSESKMQ